MRMHQIVALIGGSKTVQHMVNAYSEAEAWDRILLAYKGKKPQLVSIRQLSPLRKRKAPINADN